MTKIVREPADLLPGPNDYPWPRIHGMVQLRLAVWDRERGWLTARSSIIKHGPIETIESPGIAESVSAEARILLRGAQYKWQERHDRP